MTQQLVLTPAWREWIKTNIAGGCSVESMVQAMVRERIHPALALSSIQAAQLAFAGGSAAAQTTALPPAADAEAEAFWSRPGPAYAYEAPRMPLQGGVIKTVDRDVRVVLRVEQPVVVVLENLFSEEECDELVRLSRAKLKRSTIVDPVTGQEEVIEARASEGTYFMLNETDFIATLDRRIAQVMHWPIENGEGIQILHYGVGGEYKPHFDYFPPEDAGSGVHLARGGQRVSTMVMYLNDVAAGGETVFPELSLSVVPKKGSAVYFEYCNSLGQVDSRTLHAGQPVLQGEKWIATKWMRERRYG